MIKLLELFGGIGSQTQALKNIGIDHTSTLCEIDKYATISYEQLHGKVENLGDITKVNPKNLVEGQWDLITYSFPCQSVSIAGKQEGLSKDSGTTSSLLWECEKIIRAVKPKYLLMENVANLLSKKFFPEFEKWLNILRDLEYTNYYQILNAKDYGIPQNRERVFCVSIRGNHSYYQFPKPIPLTKKLRDMLEDRPDMKFFLSEDAQNKVSYTNKDVKEQEIKRIGGMYGQTTRWGVYDKDGISPTITASMGLGGGHIPMVKQERLTKQAFETLRENPCKDGDVINPFNKRVVDDGICPTITTRPEGFKTANLIVVDEKIMPSVAKNFEREKENIANSNKDIYQAQCKSGFQDNKIGLKVSPTIRANNSVTHTLDNHFRIRKLTPRECWRLMGWKDEQFDKIKGVSNAQLYKQAGNSIVVNVLEEIFRQLFLVDSGLPKKEECKQIELF